MKRLLPALALLLLFLSVPCFGGDFELRGVWVSTVYNLDYPSAKGLSADRLRQEADEIIMNAADWGMNAVFLQVRPCADALYSSEIYPWSAVLSGTQGTAPQDGFDPLAYFVEQAHAAGLQLHAWINPYRLTAAQFSSREEALASLAPGHPARSMDDCVIWHSDGRLYFDPGMPASRQLIVSGVEELLANYDIDGIHLDDYFYPSGEFDDAQCFAVNGEGYGDVADFRRASVNRLIQTLYGVIQTTRPQVQFGVSPFGVWANSRSHPDGSDTAGASSYYDMYADSRTWVREEMVDYIMPQLYWHIGSDEADFETLLDWWCDTVRGTEVSLYVGLAAYRVVEAEADSIWYGTDQLRRQMDLLADSSASGLCMFRYGSVRDSAVLGLFSSEYLYEEPGPWPGRLPVPATGIEDFSLSVSIAVLREEPLDLSCRGPYGGRITVSTADTLVRLEAGPGGRYSGSLGLSREAVNRPVHPLTVCETDGFLFVDILPQTVTPVEAGKPASITQIFSEDTEDGWHRVTFYTGAPIAARLVRRGTAIQLILSPCRLGVLFEDDFLEALSVKTEEERTTYTFILPRNSRNFDYDLQWQEGQILLAIRHKLLE